MRKIITTLALTLLATSAMAQHGHHGYWRHGHGGGWNWVAPVIVGGVIGYELARPPVYTQPPVVVQQPPVVVQQPIVVQSRSCSPWTEIRNPDGTVTETRTCTQ